MDIQNRMPYFAPLSADEVSYVEQHIRTLHFDAGEMIFNEGDPAEGLYYVRRGRVHIERYSPEGRLFIVRDFVPGETFNEVGALDATTNPASAVAGADGTEVWLIPGFVLRKLTEAHPDIGQHIMQSMAQKLRFAMRRAGNLALLDVKARLATTLLEQMDEDGVLQGVPHEHLAAQIGTVRQVLGRILAEWRKQGIIEVRRNWIRVLDEQWLRDMVEA